MSRHGALKGLVAGAVLIGSWTLVGSSSALAQDPDEAVPAHPAFIQAGDCTDLEANAVGSLNDVELLHNDSDDEEANQVHGTLSSSPVFYSKSEEVGFSFDDMLAESHAIAVHESDTDIQTSLACGEIGGVVVDDRLVIALHPVNESGYIGIAILTKDSDGNVDVEIYLAEPVPPENTPDATPAG